IRLWLSPPDSFQFVSKLFSGTRPLQNPSHSSVVQSSSQQPAQASYQSVAQSSGLQAAQASSQSVAQPSVLKTVQASDQSVSQTIRPQVAQVSSQQSPQASYSVTQPNSLLQTTLSRYQSVFQHRELTVFKPLQAQGGQLYQVGSKLYSCQEYVLQPSYQLAARPGWTEYQPPSRPVSPSLAQHIKPVVQPSYQAPVNHVPPGPLQSTLQSTFRLAQLPEPPSYQLPVLPSRQPLAKHRLPSYDSVSPLRGPQSGPLRQLQQSGYQPPAKARFWLLLPSHSSAVSVQAPGCQIMRPYRSLGSKHLCLGSQVTNLYPDQVPKPWCSPVVTISSYESVSQSVQRGLQYPAPNYQPVTNQNAPGPAQSSRHLSQSRSRLL
uniref:Uncharacterized protein n=1 Tax=Sinocyclocheilus grahami TaxID=75366 RepID=A0A672MD38_SINGR